MREMAATGDLTRRIRLPRRARWEDEDARLNCRNTSKSFNMENMMKFKKKYMTMKFRWTNMIDWSKDKHMILKFRKENLTMNSKRVNWFNKVNLAIMSQKRSMTKLFSWTKTSKRFN